MVETNRHGMNRPGQPSSMGLVIRQKEPKNLETHFGQVDSFLTPTELFYIRSHFPTPSLDVASYRWNHTPRAVHDEAPSSPAPSLLRRGSPLQDHVPLRPQDTPHRCSTSWAVMPGMRPSPPSEPASAARPQAEVRCKPMFGRVVMPGLLPRVPSFPRTRWPSRLGRYPPLKNPP